MTPKDLLEKISDEMAKAINPETKAIYKAQYDGALAMYELFLSKQRKYYETHKEHNREYHREYYRLHRSKKAKEVEANQ